MNVCRQIVRTRTFLDEQKIRAKFRASPHLAEMRTLCATLCGVLFGVDGFRRMLTGKDWNRLSLVSCFFRYAVAMIWSRDDKSNHLVIYVEHEPSFLKLWMPRWIPLKTVHIYYSEYDDQRMSEDERTIKFEALLVSLKQRAAHVHAAIVPMFHMLGGCLTVFNAEMSVRIVRCFCPRSVRCLILRTCKLLHPAHIDQRGAQLSVSAKQVSMRTFREYISAYMTITASIRVHFADPHTLVVDNPEHIQVIFSALSGIESTE